MELNFSEDFFIGEEIEGFFVEEMMKRAWAAQLRVLADFDEVCRKHGIKWFADYGTLLGAVRHKGYIPWDDDMDISMMREDYNVFIRKAYRDLPKNYLLINFHVNPDCKDYMTRIVNHKDSDHSPEVMEKFFGFPYSCGIDITPVDFIPSNPNDYETYKALIDMTSVAANVVEAGKEDRDTVRKMLSDIEKLTGSKINRGMSIPQQLRELCERICGMYKDRDADDVGMAIRQNRKVPLRQPKETVLETVELPFLCTTVPAPKDYETWLTQRYGADYMTPKQSLAHDYPFYKRQMELDQ